MTGPGEMFQFKASPQLHAARCSSLPDELYFVDFAPMRWETRGRLLATYPRVTCVAAGRRRVMALHGHLCKIDWINADFTLSRRGHRRGVFGSKRPMFSQQRFGC